MDTFRDRNGNINIHGDRDNDVNLRANCNGDCRMQGNVQRNLQGHTDVELQGKVNSNGNAKLNGNFGLHLNFGFRRTNGEQSSHTIFVPIDELTDVENLSSFGYRKRYAVFCLTK